MQRLWRCDHSRCNIGSAGSSANGHISTVSAFTANGAPAATAQDAHASGGEDFAREFDARLAGKTSRLIDYSPNAPRIAAEAYRAVVGQTEAQCPDAEGIDRLLNPARNLYRLEVLDVGVHAPAMRALQHANYTFAKKISHTADVK